MTLTFQWVAGYVSFQWVASYVSFQWVASYVSFQWVASYVLQNSFPGFPGHSLCVQNNYVRLLYVATVAVCTPCNGLS